MLAVMLLTLEVRPKLTWAKAFAAAEAAAVALPLDRADANAEADAELLVPGGRGDRYNFEYARNMEIE